MATTTNYSWSTPDDTALVKDGAAAIRTLGSSADTTVKALNPGTTAGDIDYYTTSTAKARLGIGTAGQLLAVNSGATAPEWVAAPASGGITLISTTTLSGASTSLTSIPQTHKHLFLDLSGITTTLGGGYAITLQFNSDTGSNYGFYRIYTNTAGTVTQERSAAQTEITFCGETSTTGGDNAARGFIDIYDYTRTTTRNGFIGFVAKSTNYTIGTTNFDYKGASAISSIQIKTNATSFTAGTVKLYGMS
jgi:hypothetical protein